MAGPSPSPEPKQPLTIVTSSFQEFTPETSSSRPRATMAQHANTVFIAISAILGLAIMATSANALQVFHSTHLSADFRLPVWPQSFDLKPTIAGVVCGVLVFVMNSVALVGQFVPALKRNPLALPTLIPLSIALLAAVVASAIPFNALTSSTKWTVQTWSCQWSNISTSTSPHWGTLCSESRAAGIMSLCVIPFDVLAVASVLASVMKARRNVQPQGQWERKGSAGEMS